MEALHDPFAIEDVGVGTREFIRRRWGKKFYLIGGALVVAGFITLPIGLGFFVLTAAVLWFGAGYVIAQKLVHLEFMRQFAEKNGFTYEPLGDMATAKGDLFTHGHSNAIWNVVSGTRGDLPIRFFFYTYTTGSGKNRQAHPFTVIEVAFGGSLPHMILDNRDDWYFDGLGDGHAKVGTGTVFDEHFILRVKEGLEIEALEVLTPEIMEELIVRGKGYSFEFVDHRLYIWKPKYARRSTELAGFLSLAHYLVDTLAPRLSRLHDDVDAVIAANRG